MKNLFQKLRFCRYFSGSFSIKSLTFQSLRHKHLGSNSSPVNAFKDVFGCSYHQAYLYFRKYPELKKIDSTQIFKTAETLKIFKISPEDVKSCPKVLCILPTLVEQRSLILKECGFEKITAKNLITYGMLIKRKISLLKIHGCIPESCDVSKNLLFCLQAPSQVHENVNKSIDGHSDNTTISYLRDLILSYYLQHMLDASDDEVKYIFSTYPRVCTKSLQLVHETLSIFLEELNFPKSHVKTHGYLIHAHPQELRKLLQKIPTLGGMPIRDFFYKYPVTAISNFETFSQVLNILCDAGISEEAILETPLILTLSVENVKKGIALLESESTSQEIKALLTHPQMLKLILRRNHVSQRINYLNTCDQTSELGPVASLNLLCGSNKVFERYVSGVGGLNKGNDIVGYLFKTLENACKTSDERNLVTATAVRDSMKRHVHWRHVPLSEIQSCLDMLLKLGFTCKEIMFSLQIVLYSSNRVKMQLRSLSEQSSLLECFTRDDESGKDAVDEEVKMELAANTLHGDDEVRIPSHLRQHALPLCLYFLEKDHHFSGDGIWFRQ